MNVDTVYSTAWESDTQKKKTKIPLLHLTSVEHKWQSVQRYQKAKKEKKKKKKKKVFLDDKYFYPIKNNIMIDERE